MGPHSRRQHGTFLLPQALVLLLSRLVKASDEAVTPSYTDLSTQLQLQLRRIKDSLCQLLPLLISFADRGDSTTSTWLFVGMVELTAICGVGSVLYQWSKHRNKKTSESSKEKKSKLVDDGK